MNGISLEIAIYFRNAKDGTHTTCINGNSGWGVEIVNWHWLGWAGLARKVRDDEEKGKDNFRGKHCYHS